MQARTDRQSLRAESVTYVPGMNCHPCDRNEPAQDWRPQRDSNPRFGLERATSWASGRWGQQGRVLRLRSTPEHVSVAVLGRSRQMSSNGRGARRKDSVHPHTNSYTVVLSDCVTLGTPLRAGRAQRRALGAARAGRGTAGRLGCVRSPGRSPAVARCRPRPARRANRRAG